VRVTLSLTADEKTWDVGERCIFFFGWRLVLGAGANARAFNG
jgi:hypothetical protein